MMDSRHIPRFGMGKAGTAALWLGASITVLALHLGAAAWMLHSAPDALAEPATQAAIMLDFSPETEAVNTEDNNISPDMQSSAEQAEITPPEKMPEPAPEVEPAPEPVAEKMPEQISEPEAEPLPEPPPVQEKAEAVLPPPKPEKPVVKKTEPKPEPRRTPRKEPVKEQPAPAQASKAAQAASAQSKQSSRTAASQTSAGARTASISPARWQSQLMAHLEKRKQFPAGATGKSGVALVRFTMDGNGRVLSASLARSSGVAAFDDEVVALVKRASPLPAPPEGAQRTIVAPVKFGRGR